MAGHQIRLEATVDEIRCLVLGRRAAVRTRGGAVPRGRSTEKFVEWTQ